MGIKMTAKKRKEERDKKVYVGGRPYIWMDGYKGTDENMRCRGLQYELNKEFTCNGVPKICDNGFHFCKHLGQVINNYYEFNGYNRYFKVKALVPLDDSRYEESKYAAKKIVFLEEVGYDKLEKYIKDECPLVDSEDDWNKCKEIGYEEYAKNIFVNSMRKLGYSKAFIEILAKENDESSMKEIIDRAKALKAENISKDLSVYLLISWDNF